MKSFIFITSEGYTYQPGSESAEPDIENCQVIGFSKGEDQEDAFRNLVLENEYLLDTNFNEIIGFELAGEKGAFFHLNDLKNYSILV